MKNKFVRIISVYQIIGGILGVLVSAYYFLFSQMSILNRQLPTFHLIATVGIYVFAIVLYSLSIISGLYMMKKKKIGYVFSIIVQCFQIPYILTPTLIYYFVNGMFLGARLGRMSSTFMLNFFFHIGSTFSIFFNTNIDGFIIGINIIPVVIIIYMLNQIKNRTEIYQEETKFKTEELRDSSSKIIELHDVNLNEDNDDRKI